MKAVGELINEVNNYFIQKIIEGDYKFVGSSEYTADILIDDTYTFQMWIGNGRESFKFYTNSFPCKSSIKIDFKTIKDQYKAWAKINTHLKEIDKLKLKREKQKEINRLQKEIENL